MGSNSSFQTFAISELIDEIAMGPFGSNIKVDCFVSEGVPVFNGSNLMGFTTNDDELRYVTNEKAKSLGRALASRGDVVVTHRGTLGQIAYIPGDSLYEHYIISQSQFRMRMNEKVLPAYLVYYFHTPLGQWKIMSNKAQTGVPALGRPTTTFQKIDVELPNIETQLKTVKLLDSFQSVIRLNQQANGYLSDMLDALFDRVIAEESCDWEVASLLDIASYKNGLAMQRFRPVGDDPGLPVLKIRELGQGYCGADAERCRSDIDEAVAIHDGDLIFSWSGTLLLDFWAGGDAGLNQHLFKVSSDAYPSWFYYMWTKRHMRRFVSLAKDRATTMGHIKRSALQESEVLIPPSDRMGELTTRMQPIVDEMIGLKVQSRILGELRDALLPKLMSGEIDVSQVAFYAGRATPSL